MARRPTYWSKTAPEGPWDDIVIGSGMGGMTTAAILAKLGRRVLVLEQHYVPGGFTHMFSRRGYTWDVGVHAVGEVTQHSMPGRILHDLTEGRLTWSSLGPVYDIFHYPDGLTIEFPDSPVAFREHLVEAFPDEEAAIDAYLEHVRGVSASMKGYYFSRLFPKSVSRLTDRLFAREAGRWMSQRCTDVLARLTDDPRLQTVLTAQWGYYGSIPDEASFAIQALVAKHFMWGAYYPDGGASEIARQLLRTVAEAGGWTRIYADVDQILLENGRAVGVRLADGEEIRASRVFSAAGVLATVQRLLPSSYEEPWMRSVREMRPSKAHVCLYIGFEGDIREAGATAANQWFYETWDTREEAWRVEGDELPDAPILYCSFPSLKDPHHEPGPKVRHTGEVVTFVPWDVFEPFADARWMKRGPEYEALKARLQEKLLAQFLRHMPELEPLIRYVELSTPASTQWFVRPVAGSIYGLEPTPERFGNAWLRPRSPIPGLFFSGSEVATVGVVGAMMGGVLAAAAAEPARATRYLRRAGAARQSEEASATTS